MSPEQQQVFEQASGVSVMQLYHFNARIMMAAGALLAILVLFGLLYKVRAGDFSNLIEAVAAAMMVSILLGLLLFIAK